MKRWFIALTIQDPLDLKVDPETGTILARTSVAVWPLLFHTAHDGLAYGQRHHPARHGWLPDGRRIVNWKVSQTGAGA